MIETIINEMTTNGNFSFFILLVGIAQLCVMIYNSNISKRR